ncbi:hypothetical protein BX666DRAFT_1952617 [Dichotomocladium elegans]|nr:hypothetical protein BX666DRAFT_1952617 [Dichotomocladium elegans]
MYSNPQHHHQEFIGSSESYNQKRHSGNPFESEQVRNVRGFISGMEQQHSTVMAMHPQQQQQQPQQQHPKRPTTMVDWYGTSLDSNESSPSMFGGMVSPSTSTGHMDATGNHPNCPTVTENDEDQKRNLQEAFEKRRRRRESHNAVERRRRENINERINELSALLPDHLIESAPTTSNVMSVSNPPAKAINKGTILKLSVEHIRELQDALLRYKNRAEQLERMIHSARRGEMFTE